MARKTHVREDLSDEIAKRFTDGSRMSRGRGPRLASVAAEGLDLVPHLAYDKKDTR